MRKYIEFAWFEGRYSMRYRANSVFYGIMSLVSFFVFFFLWKTIYSIHGTGWDYSFREMATYYLVTNLLFNFAPTCWSEVSNFIRNGFIVNFLSRPLNLFALYYARVTGFNLIYMLANFLEAIVVAFLMKKFIILSWNTRNFILMFVFWMGGGLFKFAVEYIVEIMAFWWSEVSGHRSLLHFIQAFLSGVYIPLNLIVSKSIVWLIPYNFIGYFPARIYLGKVSGHEMALGLVSLIVWLVPVILLAIYLTRKGLKVYTAPGI